MLLPHMSKNGKLHLKPEVITVTPVFTFEEPSAQNNPYQTDKLKCQLYKEQPARKSKLKYYIKSKEEKK